MQNALYTAVVALVLTTVFHFLVAGHFHAWPLAIFGVLMIIGLVILRQRVKTPKSPWSYVLLVPAVCGIIAATLYASDVVEVFAPFAIGLSLALFAFWTSMGHRKLREVPRLWSFELLRDTIFPFVTLSRFVRSFGKIPYGLRILTGILIAIPFLFVFGALFASADPLFQRVLMDAFGDLFQENLIAEIIRDTFIALYFVAAGWMLIERAERQETLAHVEQSAALPQSILASFLVAINILFLIFIGFQAAFFFGGEAIVRSYDLTYADYARGGFFQLLVVAGIVLLIAWAMYARTKFEMKLSRWLTVILIAQTGIILVSAFRRLGLYIDVYGMTVARWWAYAGLSVVGVMLAAVTVGLLNRLPYWQGVKGLFFLALCLPSVLLLVNVEKSVAQYNLKQITEGNVRRFDLLEYVTQELSADAFPVLIDALPRLPDATKDTLVMGENSYRIGNESGTVYFYPEHPKYHYPPDIRDIRDVRVTHVLSRMALDRFKSL